MFDLSNLSFDKVLTWIKNNILVAVLVALVLLAFVASKQVSKMFRGKPKRRRRRTTTAATRTRATRTRATRTRATGSSSGKGYAAVGGGTIPFKYNKDGSVKKAWQVAGTVAAKQRMSRLRKNK